MIKLLASSLTASTYTALISSISLLSLIQSPLLLITNNAISVLFSQNKVISQSLNYFAQISVFSTIITIFSIIYFILFDLTYVSYIAAIISWSLVIYTNMSYLIDANQYFSFKLYTSLACLILGVLISCLYDPLFGFLFFNLFRAILFFLKVKVISYLILPFKNGGRKNYRDFGNVIYVTSQMFGDNGIRYFSSLILSSEKFLVFDIILRIVYSIRSVLGQIQFPILVKALQRGSSFLISGFYLRHFIFLSIINLFLNIISHLFFIEELSQYSISSIITVNSICISINVFVAIYFNVFLRDKLYFILSFVTLFLPLAIIVFIYFIDSIVYSLAVSYLAQALLIYFIAKVYHNYEKVKKSILDT